MKTANYTTVHNSDQQTVIEIDNTTNFKDFNIKFEQHEINIQIDQKMNSIQIGNVYLSGIEVELFKQFISQLS